MGKVHCTEISTPRLWNSVNFATAVPSANKAKEESRTLRNWSALAVDGVHVAMSSNVVAWETEIVALKGGNWLNGWLLCLSKNGFVVEHVGDVSDDGRLVLGIWE